MDAPWPRPARAGSILGDGTIDEAIAVNWATPAQVLDAVKRAAAAAGIHVEKTAPNTLLLTGRVRPYWCVAIAGLLAIPTLGLSLFMLRIRVPGTATATLTDGPRGLHVRFTGQVPDYLPSVVEHLLAEQRPLDTQDGRPARPSDGTRYVNGSRSSAPQPPTAMPVPTPSEFADTGDVNATMARPRMINLNVGAPMLRFDSGVSVTVTQFALIGRAPVTGPGDPPAQLLPIADPDLSVSKTHLAIGTDARGLWVCDRHSTNGSIITGPDGSKTRCVPGQRHYVSSGSTVQLGDRSFSVAYAGIPTGRPS